MANHKSAEKRHRQSLKRRQRNRMVKASMRTLVKKARATAEAGPSELTSLNLRTAERAIAKAKSKGVIHRKTASRYISRLKLHVNAKIQAS